MSRKIILPNNFDKNNNFKIYPKPRLINKNGRKYVNIPGVINKNIEKSIDPEVLEYYFNNNNNLFKPNMRQKVTNVIRHLKSPYRNKTKNNKYMKFLGKHQNIMPYPNTRKRRNKRTNPFKIYKRKTLRNKRANNTETPRSVINLPKRNTKKRKINNVYNSNNNVNMTKIPYRTIA